MVDPPPTITLLERGDGPSQGLYMNVVQFRAYLQWLIINSDPTQLYSQGATIAELDKKIMEAIVHRREVQ